MGAANFEKSVHFLVWNKLRNSISIALACGWLLPCVLCRSVCAVEERGYLEGRGGEGSIRNRAAVSVPPRRGPASSVKGYVSFRAANPPAELPLPHIRTAAAQRRTRPTVSKAVSHGGSRLQSNAAAVGKHSHCFPSPRGSISQSLDREVERQIPRERRGRRETDSCSSPRPTSMLLLDETQSFAGRCPPAAPWPLRAEGGIHDPGRGGRLEAGGDGAD